MSSITRNNFSIHSNLKGNLLKTEYQKDGIVYFVKSGRLQVRDFPEKWGIEPVIEVLCYEIGKLMEQSLIGMEGIRYGKNFRTLVCSSPDFRNGKTLIYLASLYAEDESNIDFEKLCRNTGCGNDLINLLAFDLIIMNEDRHNSNVGFLMSDNGELKLSPIYDNGYSLILNWHIDTVFVMHRCMRKDLMRRKEYFRKCLKYMCLQLILILKEIKLQIGLWR